MLASGIHVDEAAKQRYRDFIGQCRTADGKYRLTPRAEATPYALCFAIFGLHLLRDQRELQSHRTLWDHLLRSGLKELRAARLRKSRLHHDKPYLQLLTFTLSALAVLGTLADDPLEEEVLAVLPTNIEEELESTGCLRGDPRSGNHAMFLGILLLHARDHLGVATQSMLEQWIRLHLATMNRFGFWGRAQSMSHLQFQNGYHQYELLEYLGVSDFPWNRASANVARLADAQGHFAPYPGGGGCYDYDAVFILTGAEPMEYRELLARTYETIRSEQNADGGFGESQYVRPRSWANLRRTVQHVVSARGLARRERLRWGASLLRPKHDRIQTHWSRYSRSWAESNLWDSWFRMLALARIEVAFEHARSKEWSFIDYPGIGFHPAIRDTPGPQ